MTSTYWDERCSMISQFLWLPSEKVLDGLNDSADNFEDVTPLRDTWFESQTYSLPYSPHNRKAAQTESTQAKRTRKIRIYPDAKQREILMHWMRSARYVYNKTMEHLAKNGKADWLTVKASILKDLPDWTENAPYQVRAIAVRDACITFHNAGGPQFRARGSSKQSVFVPKASTNRRGFYTRTLGVMDCAEDIPEAAGDCRVILDCGRWFLSVPVSVSEQAEHIGKIAAVDPGIRSFMTFYSLDSCGKVGKGAFSRIHSLCRYLDDLTERMKSAPHRQRYKMRKAADRLRWKVRNLVEELQQKTALFLVRNFDVIALPDFRAENFGSGSLREVAREAHTGFQEVLRAKAREYGVKVIVQEEAGTSGTCSWNGEVRSVGRYIRSGGVTLDRDYNGARGIFLRALRESAIHSPV